MESTESLPRPVTSSPQPHQDWKVATHFTTKTLAQLPARAPIYHAALSPFITPHSVAQLVRAVLYQLEEWRFDSQVWANDTPVSLDGEHHPCAAVQTIVSPRGFKRHTIFLLLTRKYMLYWMYNKQGKVCILIKICKKKELGEAVKRSRCLFYFRVCWRGRGAGGACGGSAEAWASGSSPGAAAGSWCGGSLCWRCWCRAGEAAEVTEETQRRLSVSTTAGLRSRYTHSTQCGNFTVSWKSVNSL